MKQDPSAISTTAIGLNGMDLTYPIHEKPTLTSEEEQAFTQTSDLDLAIINDNEFAAGVSDRSVRAVGQFELGIGHGMR